MTPMQSVVADLDLSFIQLTALMPAYGRSLESIRDQPMFADPFAAMFLQAASEHSDVTAGFPAPVLEYFAVRTKFFDETLLKAVRSGCRQVVLLAAGLDARAFRLPWPEGTKVFEVDLKPMLTFKDRVLVSQPPQCTRVTVSADLREDWLSALAGAGLDTSLPTVWLVEGLLFYLTSEEADRLLTAIPRAAGSCLTLEHVNQALLDLIGELGERLVTRGAPWRSTVDAPADWLRTLGWNATVIDQTEAAERYGRSLPGPQLPDGRTATHWLVDAVAQVGSADPRARSSPAST